MFVLCGKFFILKFSSVPASILFINEPNHLYNGLLSSQYCANHYCNPIRQHATRYKGHFAQIQWDITLQRCYISSMGTRIVKIKPFHHYNGNPWIGKLISGVSEWVIKFNGLSGDSGQRGPCSPYKPCNHSLYIEIIIFPHIDNTQSKGHNLLREKRN